MEWNVYIGDFNRRTIDPYNVFDHRRFVEDLVKDLKKIEKTKDISEEDKKAAFTDMLRRELMYYFWSKCEWEIILSHWPSDKGGKGLKVDVFDQVRLNWDKFTEYVWANRKELKSLAKPKKARKTE